MPFHFLRSIKSIFQGSPDAL